MENLKPSLETFDDFAGEYLKAEFVKIPAQIVVTGIDSFFKDGKACMLLLVEYNKRKWKFQLNKTNQLVVRKAVKTPKEIIGKVLTLTKIPQRNPSTNLIVDSLLITEIK